MNRQAQTAARPYGVPDLRKARKGTKAHALAMLARETTADAALMLHDAGGRYVPDEYRPWSLDTAAGVLEVCDPDFDIYAECGAFLHMRFREPQTAAGFLSVSRIGGDLNPFSGKWNIHARAPGLLVELRARLARVSS